ncbi:multicomponent Na+:H+ antiporter subunit E [Raineyella antarctica]|uniref:Multicomponent Na+:H+ antiporter subunit E n=1 Tax=Raineyella antarctica TaxID=1577474 RepID=A0A1G6H2J2_9ACTN|nr:Na+/H+ antiporter subunit E [Raineyella antarctica]SDB88115.1 multicomponent Na+:H+ antiporter subunit E [Raineyella antarctica]
MPLTERPGSGRSAGAPPGRRTDPKAAGAVRAEAARSDTGRTQTRWNRVGWRSILIGVLVWCILWGKADLRTILGGLAVTWGVALVFPLPAIRYRGRIRAWGVVRLIAATLVELVISSTRVALLAINWRKPVSSAIVGVRLRTTSDLLVAMIVELIGLVPGSVVVEQVRASSRVYVHVLDVSDPERLSEAYAVVRAVEERVIRAFGTDDEVALLDRPVPEADNGPAPIPTEPPAETPVTHPMVEPVEPADAQPEEGR